MRRRLILAATLAITGLLTLGGATASQATPGNLRILFDSNQGDGGFTGFLPALRGTPGVAALDTFDSSGATPSQETLAGYDLLVDAGDSSYDDPALYGDRLANYIDAGGAVIQFAYDNWDQTGAHPEGRFESGGYPPFIPGNNDNSLTSLGTILVPGSPLLAGVPSFTTQDNVTDTLAPGATLLALWADARNAIATKGQVVSVTASPEDGGSLDPVSAAAQLAVNAGNVLGPRLLTIAKKGKGTVTGTGIDCGPTCSAVFGLTHAPTLTAKAKKGSSLKGWSGGGCKGKSTCKPDISGGNTTVTATFVKKCKKKKHKAAQSAKKKCKKKKRS
jgi:Divergent InlB B-repeat domain